MLKQNNFHPTQVHHRLWTPWLQWDAGGTAGGRVLREVRLLLVASASCDLRFHGLVRNLPISAHRDAHTAGMGHVHLCSPVSLHKQMTLSSKTP